METIGESQQVSQYVSRVTSLQVENAQLRDLLEKTSKDNLELSGRNLSLVSTNAELRCRVGRLEAELRSQPAAAGGAHVLSGAL